jgi:hypothetical protein
MLSLIPVHTHSHSLPPLPTSRPPEIPRRYNFMHPFGPLHTSAESFRPIQLALMSLLAFDPSVLLQLVMVMQVCVYMCVHVCMRGCE